MKYNLIFILIILSSIFLIDSVSAVSASYIDSTFTKNISDLGTINLKDNFGIPFISNKVADITLISNENSIIDSWAYGKEILYQSGSLFDGLNVYNNLGSKVSLNNMNLYYESNESYINSVPIYEDSCNKLRNESGEYSECTSKLVSTKEETLYRLVEHKYILGTILPSGEYYWRIEASKKANERLDWVVSSHGKELKEWAWWNSTFNNAQKISGLQGSITQQFVLNSTGMNWTSGFSDIRFTDVTNTTELNYTFIPINATGHFYNSSGFMVRIDTHGADSIFMYYNNSLANTKSNATAVYGNNLVSGWAFEERSGNNVFDLNSKSNGSITNYIKATGNWSQAIVFPNTATDLQVKFNMAGNISLNFTGDVGWFSTVNSTSASTGLYTQDCGANSLTSCIAVQMSPRALMSWQTNGAVTISNATDIGSGVYTNLAINDNATIGQIYRNSVLQTLNVNNPSAKNANNVGTQIGDRQSNDQQFSGTIDEMYIFNRELTVDEINKFGNQSSLLGTYSNPISLSTQSYTILNSPSDISNFSNNIITLNATNIPYSTATNITYYVWNSSSSLFGLNTTVVSGTIPISTAINITLSEGNYLWNALSCDNNGCNFAPTNFSFMIDTTIPTINIIYPSNNSYIYSLNSSYETFILNISVSDVNLGYCNYNSTWDSTLRSYTCNTFQQLNLTDIFGKQTIYVYANDTLGNNMFNQTTIFIERVIYPSTNFETQTQTYSLEIWNNSNSINSYNFTYNGITYTPTLFTIEPNRYSLNYSLDTPIGITPIFFNWNFQDSIQRFTGTYNNTVNQSFLLGQCNSTFNNVFWNISFKNETSAQERVTSSLIGTLNYWLGSGSISKSLTYTNTSENFNYIFCALPSNLNLSINGSLNYYNSVSQTRTTTLNIANYSNVATNQTLYLLPTILGIYARFITLTSAGGVLNTVNSVVTRVINGNSITIGQGVSDSSGLYTIFVDPTASYNFAFTKVGYNNNLFTIVPNNNQNYNVYMSTSGTTTQIVNGSSIANNLSIAITPLNSTLKNNTVYSFGFNVSGNNIIFISENITNSTGQQIGYISGVNGFISTNINTLNNSFFTGNYQIQTATENFTFIHSWSIGNYYVGTYSLYTLMTGWALYGFQYDYLRILFILLTLMIGIGGLSKLEITDTSESKIWTGVFIVWAFSYVGWLNIPSLIASPSSPLYNITQYASQYTIALLSTIFSLIAIKEVIT